MTRRDAARATAMTALSYSRVLGANDKVGLGVIGTGGRGQYVMSRFQLQSDVEVRAVCDVYGVRLDEAQGKAPGSKAFTKHEDLLAMKEVDAVLIGSPDHWHKDHACDAMNAGKDVYVEKPICRTLDEAPVMVRTARKTGRICQVGVQQRSGPIYIEPLELFVKSGKIGKVNWVEAVWNSGPPSPSPRVAQAAAQTAKPSNLDWVRFLGPVAYRDWNPRQYFNFRAYLDFNGGRLTDFGHHWMDVVHMYLGERAPDSAVAAGGIYFGDAGHDAPDTVAALFEYPGFTVSFQSLTTGNPTPYGITFFGDQGKLFVDRNKYIYTPVGKNPEIATKQIPGDITTDHVRNFVDCCKSRKLPNGDVGLAAISVVGPLLGVKSYIEKRRLKYDATHMIVLPG
ncbi:MAG TPA: Gfo/Idh/MocA family oxidoreductase [Bryobacteraceae bacterium]|nr:Gfo/Idh/MocA family oxidoreductase [Bryobacteraceae bacterium]